MTDPKYADRWPGLGRVQRLMIEHRVQLFACSECAGIVIDQERHTEWHRSLGVS